MWRVQASRFFSCGHRELSRTSERDSYGQNGILDGRLAENITWGARLWHQGKQRMLWQEMRKRRGRDTKKRDLHKKDCRKKGIWWLTQDEVGMKDRHMLHREAKHYNLPAKLGTKVKTLKGTTGFQIIDITQLDILCSKYFSHTQMIKFYKYIWIYWKPVIKSLLKEMFAKQEINQANMNPKKA